MPAPTLLNFRTIVANSAAAVHANCATLLNLMPGSVLRSFLEASAGVGLWIQRQIVLVWLGTRLSTSTGTDIDTFVGDFGLARLPAVTASGIVTFSRSSTSPSGPSSLIVPYFNADGTVNTSGAEVTTADGTQSFGVITDTSNAYWNVSQGGYLVPSSIGSVDLTVKCISSGMAGNVQAGTISLLSTAIAGIDTASNAQPLENGADQETDAQLKARFQNYINTRAEGTRAAVEYAIVSVQQGLSYSISENQDAAGNYQPGNFVVVVDDGTGAPPASLISSVYAGIDVIRPIGSTFSVLAPRTINVSVSMTISVGPNGKKSVIQGTVQQAILKYIDALPIGVPLIYTRLAQIAYDADPNITAVSSILLNGTSDDVPAGTSGVIKASSGSVAIN